MAPQEKRPRLPKSAFTISKLPDLSSELIAVRLGRDNFNYDEPGEQGPTQAKIDPRQRRIEDFFNITVKRGDEHVFHVHRDVLCQTSAFFQAATKQVWRGYPHKPVDLTTEHNGIFKQYMQWLYSGRITVLWSSEPTNEVDSSYNPTDDLIEQYLFGGRMMDPTFQNAAIKALMDCLSNGYSFPRAGLVRDVYKGTMADSPIRKLLLDIVVNGADQSWDFSALLERAGEEFTKDLIVAFAAKRPKPDCRCKCNHTSVWACPQNQAKYYAAVANNKKRKGAPA